MFSRDSLAVRELWARRRTDLRFRLYAGPSRDGARLWILSSCVPANRAQHSSL